MPDLPTQIRERAAGADKLIQDLHQGMTEAAASGHGSKTPTGAQPGAGNTGGDGAGGEAGPYAAGAAGSGGAPAKTPMEELQEKYDTLSRAHSALQGKYNAEVPRLSQENRGLRDQHSKLAAENQRLKDENKRLQDEAEAAAKRNDQGAAAGGSGTGGELSPSDFEEYGEPFKRLAAEVETLKAENKTLKAELDGTKVDLTVFKTEKQKAGEDQQARAEGEFFAKVEAVVPNWADINRDPAFVKDLKFAEYAGTGRTKLEVLSEARAAHDANTVVKIFKEFIDKAGSASAAEGAARQKKIDKQVSPDTRGSGADPAANVTGKIWTRKEIQEFYKNVQIGKYRGREAEQKKIEADIFAAQKVPGRIV